MNDVLDDLIEGMGDSKTAKAGKGSKEDKQEIARLGRELRKSEKRVQTLELLLDSKGGETSGEPMLVNIEDVIEDPDNPQPRREVDEIFEEWLTANIKEQFKAGGQGVQDPISVRWSEKHEKWLINKGHTRRKCAERAGLKQVPVIVQEQSTDVNQVIENLIRNDLSTRDIVSFMAKKKQEGVSQAEIGRLLSRDKAWVSKHCSLIDPHPLVKEVWESEAASDFTVLYALNTAVKKNPKQATQLVNKLIRDKGSVSESDVLALQKELSGQADSKAKNDGNKKTDKAKKSAKLVVKVQHDNAAFELVVKKARAKGHIVISKRGKEIEVPAASVSLIGVE